MPIYYPLYDAIDPTARDAFGRLRTSEPFTIWDSKQLYDKAPLFWDESITNGSGNATSLHATADAGVTMHAEAGDTVIRQSFERHNYQAGKSQYALLTGVLGASVAGVTRRIGLFDANNGLFFQLADSALSVVVRKGTVDTVVPQASWNVDTLDGNGPSGITLNTAKAQIFYFDFEWLGVGTVRFGVVIDGAIIWCHKAHHANSVTTVYMNTPNLPVRYEIVSTTGTADLLHICSMIMSEGGVNPLGVTFSTSSSKLDADVAGTSYALIGLKLRTTHLGAHVDIRRTSVLSATNDSFLWRLVLSPTVAGSFTYTGLTNSACEVATGATANTVTGGTVLASGYGYQQTGIESTPETSIRIGSTIGGTPQAMVLAVTPLGNTADIYGTITWREL